MNISPQTNLSSPVHAEQKTVTSEQNSNNSSSKDLASVSTTPAVKVGLSVSENSQAAANAALPQLYSRISLAKNNQEQLYVDDDQRAAPFENDEVASKLIADEDGRTVGSDDSDLEDEVRTQNGDQQSVERSSTESAGERRIEEQQEAIIEEQIAELRARDQEVRAHEQAHKAVGGQYAGAASFTYQSGPDGNRYAVGGEVSIDISPIPNDPQATISKMNTVKAAANAPAEPSGQDRAVAAQAQRVIAQAQAELVEKRAQELEQTQLQAQENKDRLEKEKEQTDARKDERSAQVLSVQEFERIASLDQKTVSDIDDLI